jgi:uncharacterized protein YndB with AHSA1/START domain
MISHASTVVSRILAVPRQAIYRAFLDPDALAAWLPPDSMRGVVHAFDPREGEDFSMSLLYPQQDGPGRGKTTGSTDTFRGRFASLVPNERVVWVTEFESADPSFAGEMTITTTLEQAGSGTRITMRCDNIPPGISLADNEAGCRASLDKLAAFLAGARPKSSP